VEISYLQKRVVVGELEEYIKSELNRMLSEALAKLPWWCFRCGEGGNYVGERPDEFWFPPKDHVCPPRNPKVIGLPVLPAVDIETFDVGPIFRPSSFIHLKEGPGVPTMSEDQYRERGF
jgi:hypothetical protein